jgi:1-acyl-sn-glycerol-3-phosphate acyltransferase
MLIKISRWAHTAFLIIVGSSLVVVCTLFFPIIAFIFPRDEYKLYQLGAKSWAGILLSISGIKLAVEGRENIPNERPLILVSNHQSYFDIPVLLAALPLRARFLTWSALFKIPFFGVYIKKYGAVPVSDYDPKQQYKAILDVIKLIRQGDSALIFPEGMVTRDNKINRFGRGAATVALNTGVPILPIAISGNFEVFKKGEWLIKPGRVLVRIGKPFRIDKIKMADKDDYAAATQKIREEIGALFEQNE